MKNLFANGLAELVAINKPWSRTKTWSSCTTFMREMKMLKAARSLAIRRFCCSFFFPCWRFYRTYYLGRHKRQLPEVAMKNRFARELPELLSNYSEQNQRLAMSSWYMTLQLLCNCQNPLLIFCLMSQLPFRVLATSMLTKLKRFFVCCLHFNHQIAGGMRAA